MSQAANNRNLYRDIHGQLIDALWKKLKSAYISGRPTEILACKNKLKQEMRQLGNLSLRHYRMRLLLALGDSMMRRYCTSKKK